MKLLIGHEVLRHADRCKVTVVELMLMKDVLSGAMGAEKWHPSERGENSLTFTSLDKSGNKTLGKRRERKCVIAICYKFQVSPTQSERWSPNWGREKRRRKWQSPSCFWEKWKWESERTSSEQYTSTQQGKQWERVNKRVNSLCVQHVMRERKRNPYLHHL